MKTKRLLLLSFLSLLLYNSCIDNDPVLDNYFTFTGKTVADYLTDADEGNYSSFVSILDRANMFDMLSTYGEYTCFAPTNEAIDRLLAEKQVNSVDALTDADCDTIARTHIIVGAFYTTDLVDGAIPATNYLDRYLMYSTDSATVGGQKRVAYYINKNAEIIIRDDSVTNGVVHTLNKIITSSNLFLPHLMAEDTTISIFTQAMRLTGLDKQMEAFIDNTYSVGADSTELRLTYTTGSRTRPADYPSTRKFGFTAFVEPDAVYHRKGVYNLEDLINKLTSKEWRMHDPYSRYAYDNEYKKPNNVLYRFVAYHLLDRLGNYDDWTVTGAIREAQPVFEYLDPQDFYETLCPHSILKFQFTREGELYINRRRVNEGAAADHSAPDPFQVAVRGVRVYQPSEGGKRDQSAINGVYHYIDDILIYDAKTADALNTRMRIDATTLSPDFMNNVGRGRTKPTVGDSKVTLYKPGFVKNFIFTEQTKLGLRIDPLWSPSYQCDALDFLGQYDFSVKIPPVPEGQYEIRIGMNMGTDRGIVQIYFDGKACGIPIDMRISKFDNPKIGAVIDSEDEEENKRNDKDMKNRGFMKGPDSWMTGTAKTESHREYYNSVRVVLANEYLAEGKDHYIRFNTVIDNPNGLFPFDYLELCPKSVYANPEGEDTH
jgi:uncharacterized surface protein with fasciclin (FAS1) repeats